MSFLNPFLAALVPLAFLPLVIHLLNKKFPRLIRFSSLELLKKASAERSRLFRWRHLILMLMRTAIVILLIFVFLRPVLRVLGSNPQDHSARHVLIVLDHSLSMEAKTGSLSSREKAGIEAAKIIDGLRPDETLNVIAAGGSPEVCFVEGMSNRHGEARAYLDKLGPGLERGDFNKANAKAAQLLTEVEGRIEIFYLSDFQRKNWASVRFDGLPEGARLFFVDVSPDVKHNRAILEAAASQATSLAGDVINLEATVGNYSDRALDAEVAVLLDGRPQPGVTVRVPPWAVGRVEVPLRLATPGMHTCELRLPGDGLTWDDRHFLVLRVLDKEEILIVSDEKRTEHSAAHFLEVAMNPYPNRDGSLLPTQVTTTALSPLHLARAGKVFMTGLTALSKETCALLARFLQDGGHVVYFLDGAADGKNLEMLDEALGGETVPLKISVRQKPENLARGAQQIASGDFDSKYLRLFKGAQRQNLALLSFYEYYYGVPTGHGNVLLAFADQTPALASAHPRLGTLLLCNFSAGELASNMARQRSFPAWIQDLVKVLGEDESPPSRDFAGGTLQAEVWKRDLHKRHFTGPDGGPVPASRTPDGDRYHVAIEATLPGIYSLQDDAKTLHAFAANVDPAEADLRGIDPDLLPSAVGETRSGHFVEGTQDYQFLVGGRPVFHWFLLAALALLLTETALLQLFRIRAR